MFSPKRGCYFNQQAKYKIAVRKMNWANQKDHQGRKSKYTEFLYLGS